MEIVRSVRGWGNSSGVLLPKWWEGKEVKVILIDMALQVRKDVFSILGNFLEDIEGIYLVGSFSRGEEETSSDIDIIAVSWKTRKEIISGRYHINIYTLDSIKKALNENPLMIYPRLVEAKAILNKNMLEQLKRVKITRNSFRQFADDTKRIIRINSKLIGLAGGGTTDVSIIYSLMLRLRGVFLIKTMLEKKKYSNELFKKWLNEKTGGNTEDAYMVYRAVRDSKKAGRKVKVSLAKKLLHLLETEVEEL